MKQSNTFIPVAKPGEEAVKTKTSEAGVPGRWSAEQRVRLPHKVGLPLSSGGGGDGGA
jgi:hypothetical protein